jgi:hypothetical protein
MTDLRPTGFDPDRFQHTITAPGLDDLRTRARRRRLRTRLAAVGLLVAAVVAPGMAAVLGRAPDQPPTRPAATQLAYWDGRVAVGYQQLPDSCEFRFVRSDDGGGTWSTPAGPDTEAYCLRDNNGEIVSHREAYVLTAQVYLVGVGATVHVSTDAGHTWYDVTGTDRTVAAFPPWSQPVNCLSPCPGLRPPVAVDPVHGTLYRLADPPTSNGLAYVTGDGALWTGGPATDGTGTALAVSTDRGATWQFTVVPGGVVVHGIGARDARQAFVLSAAMGEDRSTLWRTADGGHRWQEQATQLPVLVSGVLTVGADGRLLVGYNGTDNCLTWISTDDGDTFRPGTPGPLGALDALPGRIWTSSFNLSTPGQVTVDGTAWTSVPMPTR